MVMAKKIWMRCLSVSLLLGVTALFNAAPLCAETATLSWTAPSTNTDGSVLTDLAGYKVYIGSSPDAVSESIDAGNVTSYQVNGLTAGATYYFTVTAYDTSGNESGFANWVSKTVPLPVEPEPLISINDSVAPGDDLSVPFGDITEYNSSEETVMVRNLGDAGLALGNIGQANEPFTVVNDGCSWKNVQPSGSCAFTVRFSPVSTGSFNGSINVPSNDKRSPVMTVALSGNGLSSATNNPPSEPVLVAPANNGKGADKGNKVGFRWKKSKDPDGDAVTYDLTVCQDPDMTTNCETQTNIASVTQQAVYYAGVGGLSTGLIIFSVVFMLPLRAGGRKIMSVLAVALSVTGMLFITACGGGGSGGESSSSGIATVSDAAVADNQLPDDEVGQTLTDFASATTYYWQVVARDGKGGESYSPVWKFETQ